MSNLLIKKEFKYKYNISFYKEFLWKTGNLSSYWYQVVGCCKNIGSSPQAPPDDTSEYDTSLTTVLDPDLEYYFVETNGLNVTSFNFPCTLKFNYINDLNVELTMYVYIDSIQIGIFNASPSYAGNSFVFIYQGLRYIGVFSNGNVYLTFSPAPVPTDSAASDCRPFKTDDNSCNYKESFFVQTILASSTEDVCQQLLNNNWNWELCSVKKWSKPAENFYVDSADDCNFLQEVPFKDLPECLTLGISQEISMKIKLNMDVDIAVIPVESIAPTPTQTPTPTPSPTTPGFTYPPTPTPTPRPPSFDITADLDELNIPIPLVYINCSKFSTLSSRLYCANNLTNLGSFSNFILNNGQEFDSNFSLIYSKNTNSWIKNFYYSNNTTAWNVSFSLGYAEGTELQYYWKFLMLFKKTENGVVLDSKLNITVPGEYVCGYNSEFIFNFNFNVIKNTLFTNINYFRDDFVFYDRIGLFTNNYWFKNPEIYIRITENYDPNLITRKIIDY